MKQLTMIILCAMICISASVVSKNVFTPAKPKQFYINEFNSPYNTILEAKKLSLKGWQNIRITSSDSYSANPNMVLTAEKY